jgi:outer membrane protein assembly factor BamB
MPAAEMLCGNMMQVVHGSLVLQLLKMEYCMLALQILICYWHWMQKQVKKNSGLKANGYVFGKPAIIGNTVYFGDFTGKMYSLDITSAGKIWNSFSTEKRSQNAGIILKNDTLDFAFAAKGGDLSFYDVNKEVMDDFYTLGPIVSSPLVQGGVLFFGSADGYLYALKLKKE